LSLAALAVDIGVLALLVRNPPRRLRGPFRRPILAAAIAGAALSVLVSAAPLVLNVVARQRAREVGLVTQGWGGYAFDVVRSWAIGAVFAAIGAAVAVALIRRLPRAWWIPGSVAVVAFGAISTYAGPIVLDPIFNRFTALPAGQTRDDVLELAQRAGVDVGEVYVMDASKRTTAANAYVNGLGHTKRVVLYDNLLNDFSRDEVRLVVAHELGHVRYDDLSRGLLWLAIVTPFGMFAVSRMTQRLAPGDSGIGPAVLPALALSVTAVVLVLTCVSNQLSRRVEARADSYALELTGEAEAFISFQRRISLKNLSDQDPWVWSSFLLGTHPTTIDRIGVGVAEEDRR
ncbi:MAG: endopeptidase, partial [Solirubrobacteraceae bacterium]|nr:endopeptidase [Solirubrobacteraceae bacterium]